MPEGLAVHRRLALYILCSKGANSLQGVILAPVRSGLGELQERAHVLAT
jgi:hypothetical protein